MLIENRFNLFLNIIPRKVVRLQRTSGGFHYIYIYSKNGKKTYLLIFITFRLNNQRIIIQFIKIINVFFLFVSIKIKFIFNLTFTHIYLYILVMYTENFFFFWVFFLLMRILLSIYSNLNFVDSFEIYFIFDFRLNYTNIELCPVVDYARFYCVG